MPRVVLTNPIHPQGMALLEGACEVVAVSPTDREAFRAALGDADALIVRTPVGAEVFEWAPRLKVLARHGVGLDFVPLKEATERNIPVVFTPEANTESVAQHVVGAILCLVRGLPLLDQAVRAGDWGLRHSFVGKELQALQLGIVGLGRIGRRVAEIAHHGFGMPVNGYDPYLPSGAALPVPLKRWDSLDDMLPQVDVVTLHVPLSAETRGLLGERRISLLKEGAFLINAARGPLVQEAALLSALATGRVRGAALDVFDEEPLPANHPYLREERILLTPHSAALTEEGMRRMSTTVAADVLRVLRGERPQYLANPHVWDSGARTARAW